MNKYDTDYEEWLTGRELAADEAFVFNKLVKFLGKPLTILLLASVVILALKFL